MTCQLDAEREKENTFHMWKTLKDRYEKKGLPGQIFLKKGESLEKHCRI